MYSNNFTCKYVYADTTTSPPNGTNPEITIKLPPQSVRSPDMKIQLISNKFISDTEYPSIVIRMDQPSDSYYSGDFKGPVLSFSDVIYARSTNNFFHYGPDNGTSPEYIIPSSTQEIRLRFSSPAGVVLLPGIFSTYGFIFKLSYPVQDEIQNQFMNQINTGF